MSILDIVFITLFVLYVGRGFIAGLVSSTISLISKAAALFLAVGATPYVTFVKPFWAFWGILLIFLAVISLFRVVVLRKNNDTIVFFDRLLGGVVSFLDAVLVIGLVCFFMMAFSPAWLNLVESSRIGDFFASYIHQAQTIIPV
jgi:uncharacterized membrane protein required for colicin V production